MSTVIDHLRNGLKNRCARLSRNVVPFVFSVLSACLVSSPVAAQEVTPLDPERVDELIELVAKHNCQITGSDAETLFSANGFSDKTEVRAILARLLFHGRARLQVSGAKSTLMVFDGPCPASEATSDAKFLFLTLLAKNGCSASIEAARPLMSEAGLSIQEVRILMPLLLRTETVSLSDDRNTISLSEEDCHHYTPAMQASDLSHDPVNEPRAALIEYLETTGCIISYGDAQEDLPKAGFDFDKLDKLIPGFVDDGIMEIGPDETLILTTGACG